MKIVVHRGNVPGFQENTRLAFEQALSLPIHGVECDVRMCRSGELVVFHDRRLGRTDVGANGFAKISALTLTQLRQLNFGTEDTPQRIMTLPELLGLIKDAGDKHLYLEIKHPSRYGRMQEEQIKQALIYAGMLTDERIHIISFSHKSIRRMATLTPAVDRIYLRRPWELRYNPQDLMFSRPTALGLDVAVAKLRPDLIGSLGLPTYLWIINQEDDLAFARAHGVEIIATDDPVMVLNHAGERVSVD